MGDDTNSRRIAEINEYLTRRKMLQGVTAGGAAMIAGCVGGDGGNGGNGNGGNGGNGENGNGNGGNGGNGNGNGGNGNDGNGGNTADVTLYKAIGSRPDESHMNPFGSGQALFHGDRWGRLIFDQLARFSNNTAETYQEMAEELEFNEDQVDVVMREQTWHNGESFTTESVQLMYDIRSMIDEHTGESSSLTRFVDEIEVSDDHAFTFHLTQEWNPSFIASAVLDEQLYTLYPGHWNEWRSRLEDAGPGTDEFDSVLDELAEHTPREIDGTQFLGIGPYQVDTIDSSTLVLTTYEEHPNADEIEYGTIEGTVVEDPVMAFIEDETDILAREFPLDSDLQAQAPPEDQLDSFSQDINRAFVWVFNTANENYPTTEREIRHAMAFAVDRGAAATAMGEAWEAVDWPASWLHWSDVEDDVIDTSGFVMHNQDTDRAAELVSQSDGFVYEDGQVLNSETNEQVPVDIMVGDRPETNSLARSYVDDLADFGFDATLDSTDAATFGSRRSDHDWTTYVDPGGIDFSEYNWRSEAMLGWNQDRFGYPTTWNIPMPVGESNLSPDDSETEPFDLSEEIPRMEQTTDEEQITDALHRLSWAFNQYLPAITVGWRPTAGAVKNQRFEVTTDNDGERHGTGQWYLYRNGYFGVV